MITKTAYETLEDVANIVDPEARKKALRELLVRNNALAIVIQRTYHPYYNWDLPPGELPETVAKKSGHQEAGPFYHSIKRWEIFRVPSEVPSNGAIKKHTRETQFISLYEGVASLDADLLIAVKDKKLPWETLNAEFIVDAIPELFPPSFRDSATAPRTETNVTTATANTATKQDEPLVGKSKIDLCKEIMQKNPGLTRKDYLELFQEVGISKVTGAQYYQKLKDIV